MEIRKATTADLPAMLAMFARARAQMCANGNPNQWGDDRPAEATVRADIAAGHSYVCTRGDELLATFCFFVGDDPTYARIDGGAWLDAQPYGVVHRIASSGAVRGAASRCMDWCFARCGNLRIDTHEDNAPMRALLEKQGFVRCGVIYLENGAPRLAFQKNR